MGLLQCIRCGARAEGNTFEEADSLIDHAAPSKACDGNPDNMVWSGTKKDVQPKKQTIVNQIKAKQPRR